MAKVVVVVLIYWLGNLYRCSFCAILHRNSVIMKGVLVYLLIFLWPILSDMNHAMAQKPEKLDIRLRFDQMQQEQVLADIPAANSVNARADSLRFVCKLNRRCVSVQEAYDVVTLWNVRRVSVKNRRMRLSDSTKRERVHLMKFFMERDPKKGAQPHLLGNVSGYQWRTMIPNTGSRGWKSVPAHIAEYTLRSDYDSLRRAENGVAPLVVPSELWRKLSYKAVYEVDGKIVPGNIVQFIDGLILRTLTINTDSATMRQYGTNQGVVIGDTYPTRIPLVIIGGKFSTVVDWLELCRAGVFKPTASVPMYYYYLFPVEAVQIYGVQGKYGAICIGVDK